MNKPDHSPDALYHGYYGKVPAKGDFISKNLPRGFTDPWHSWVKEWLARSKHQLGEAWQEYYLTTPLYQYILSPGICGNHLWIGVMMPSVDRVGRYFPMTICKTVPTLANPFVLFDCYQSWFDQTEQLLLSCLAENFSVEALNAGLSGEGEENEEDESTITLQKINMHHYADSMWQFPLVSPRTQKLIYPALMKSLVGTFFPAYSLWQTRGSDDISASVVLSENLPSVESITAFMDGNWKKWGWQSEHIIQH